MNEPWRRSADDADQPGLVYGRNPFRELLDAGRRDIHEVWALPSLIEEEWLSTVRCKPRDKASLTRLAGSPDHQGVVAACQPYPYVDVEEILAAPGPVVVLDAVQDVHNLGAVARVAETLGAAGLVIADKGSPGVTPAVCKTSAGAVEHLRIARVPSMVAFVHDARRDGRRAIGADSDAGVDYRTSGLDSRSILVLGSEGEGLRPRLRSVCDEIVAIPMVGKVASLNLSVASAILLARAVLGS
jgi:23S rRNA (guanosine2251-2'-O)-methyltransferase